MNKSRERVAAFPGIRCVLSSQQGFSLLEILVALGILAAAAVTFLAGMETSSMAVMLSQERVAAESLAKSQMESIKSWEYDEVNSTPNYEAAKLPDTAGYDIAISALRWDPVLNIESTDDTGLQQITVTITSDEEQVFELVGYKVNR